MNLPSQTALEDAAVQLEYAAQQLAPLVEMLALRCEQPPTNPAHRPRWEQNTALLRALKNYFGAVANAQTLHDEQVDEIRKEMGAAQFRYAQLGVERDYLKTEMQQMNQRYYASLDLLTTFQTRFAPHAAA
jgi:hypothetical protein